MAADQASPPDSKEPTKRVGGRLRSLALFVCLASTLALGALFGRLLVDRTAPRLGQALADLLQGAFAFRVTEEQPEPPEAPLALEPPLPMSLMGLDVLHPSPSPKHAGARFPRTGGIFVRADVVAAAVNQGVIPSGVPVAAHGSRPAGIELQGVSGYGAGLRDGDVLTQVSGAPATSVGMVIGTVTAALKRRAKVITGEVWRGDQRLVIAVEIPPLRSRRGFSR